MVGAGDWHAWPSQAADEMISVVVQPKAEVIPADKLTWQMRLPDGTVRESVGFCWSLAGMIVTYGILEEGDLSNPQGGENPLLAFVQPRAMEGLVLVDPRGQEGSLNLSGTWRPGLEHLLSSFTVSAAARTSMGCMGPGYSILPTLPR